jgi:Winged helix-turn-helix DNA-binding
MLVFVGCNYERLPFPDYRDVFREVQNAEPRVRFFFADARITNQSIMQKVRENILSCDLGLYDVTFRNPNVMMELGIALGANKHWNILYNPKQDRSTERRGWFARPGTDDPLPANLRGYEYLEYGDRSQLKRALEAWCQQTLENSPLLAQRWANSANGILGLLRAQPDLTMNEIASRTGVEVPMARLTVSELRKKGLVRTNGRRGLGARYSITAAVPPPLPPTPRRPELGTVRPSRDDRL